MPNPREVFEQPENHWSFLTAATDADFEGQHFDRKEGGRKKADGTVDRHIIHNLIGEITECISAFANFNKIGGLLVLGISKDGEIKGISHLTDEQRNGITNISVMLANQAATAKFFDCQNELGLPDFVCLIYVPYTEYAICETFGSLPKAWLRQGAQNILMNHSQQEQLRRDKRIVDFEQAYCCPYDHRDLDQAVLREFRASYSSLFEYDAEEFLYQIGALTQHDGSYAFTNAGLLFFASNPQRKLTTAYIRLLRFEGTIEDIDQRGLPTFERVFSGPLTKQIRDMRTFFKETGFFKIYQRRNPGGGFLEEPEYPYISVDEAIVNAVAHRDYAVSWPSECEAYKDSFLVRNPGRIIQRGRDVPKHFSLDNTRLVSTPRNPKLIEWLKIMRDSQGIAFIRALSEGTKRMSDEMLALHLPAPAYEVSESQTAVILTSNASEREALMRNASRTPSTEFANLFPLSFLLENGQVPPYESLDQQRKSFMNTLRDTLAANGWFIDSLKFGRLIAHRQKIDIPLPANVTRIVRFYPAYSFQLRSYWGRFYLCIDYTLEVKNIRTVQALLGTLKPSELVGRGSVAQWKGWQQGKIVSADREWSLIHLFEFEQEEQISSNMVIPNLPTSMIEQILIQQDIQFDLYQAIKEHSLALEINASRIRIDKTQAIAKNIAEVNFPLSFGGIHAFLQPTPLLRQETEKELVVNSLQEPSVEFNHRHETVDIRTGITTYGSYDRSPKMLELIPICTPLLRQNMVDLIERLKTGSYKYRGSERTFSTRLTYNTVITVTSPEALLDECGRLLTEHNEWIGDENLSRIFLLYTPEKGYSSDDENSPYYRSKRFLLEQGIPCQMLDTQTLQNPDWKDLNLALNIVAKCGITPWVLPDAIPDADFFVGLSFTGNYQRGSARLMGYANVFNQYGRWVFYSGNTTTFSYDERVKHFHTLIRQTLERLALPETPSIYFHYSAKFSKEDRIAILQAARSVRPKGTYTFIWINTHHNVRLYDSRAETNGSLSRGNYVITSPYQFYLSTTGNNPYRKMLGTPHMLEINVYIERPEDAPHPRPDLREVAQQILSLTKLNWASTDSLCAEPITIKYAGNIAYLTDAFLRQDQTFHLHKALEKTPWFL
jgi:predicted HTH transcriptional regulator